MKNIILFLSTTIIFILYFSCSALAQDKLTVNESRDDLFRNSVYIGVGGGYGYNTSLWSDYPYSGFTGKAGCRWKLKGSNYSTYNLGIQVTLITFSRNKNLGQTSEYFSSWLGMAGIGLSNMFRVQNNFGFEVNINLVPHIQKSSEKSHRYIGPMANLELRMRYKLFYLGIDSGISLNIRKQSFILGGYTGLKLGANIFMKK